MADRTPRQCPRPAQVLAETVKQPAPKAVRNLWLKILGALAEHLKRRALRLELRLLRRAQADLLNLHQVQRNERSHTRQCDADKRRHANAGLSLLTHELGWSPTCHATKLV